MCFGGGMNNVIDHFIFWVLSVEEDDPIPYEIKHIYFCLNFVSKTLVLSFGGSEQFQNPFFDFEYYPLEAQFFNDEYVCSIEDVYTAKVLVKDLIESALENPDFKRIFKDKNIYVCEFGEKIDWTFKVWFI